MFAFGERAREPGGAAPRPDADRTPPPARIRRTTAPPTIRRRFVGDDAKPVTTDSIVAALGKSDADAARKQLLAVIGGTLNKERAQYVVRKLQEGTDIPYKVPADIATAAAAAIKRTPAFFDATSIGGAVGRRLNRLRGQLTECAARLGARKDQNELVTAVVTVANEVIKQLELEGGTDAATLRTTMDEAVKKATALVPLHKSSAWSAFEVYSRFGPVSYQLGLPGLPDTPVAAHTTLLTSIRAYRHATLATVDNIGVVAHRGTGPTNRTMGKLIADEDQRRKNRQGENSEGAFEVALGQRSTEAEAKLDGVECDVYLSNDGVAIVTHEHDVVEQLPAQTRARWKGSRLVERLDAAEIKILERKTGVAKSRFLSLDELIELVAPEAEKYFAATGRPFRLEIEMKGTLPKYEKEVSPDTKRRIGGQPGQLLTKVVAKLVSQAKKAQPGLPIEFVLFNNERPDIDRFSALRQEKTALGDVTTAINLKDYHGRLDQPADRLALDEVRFGLASMIGPRNEEFLNTIARLLADYLATGVFAQEFAPPSLVALRTREPSRELEGDNRVSVGQQARRRGEGGTVDDEQHFAALCEYLKQGKLPVQRFRMLTDYPEKAAFLKAEVAKALKPVDVGKAGTKGPSDVQPSAQPILQPGIVASTEVTAPVLQPTESRMAASTRPNTNVEAIQSQPPRMAASTMTNASTRPSEPRQERTMSPRDDTTSRGDQPQQQTGSQPTASVTPKPVPIETKPPSWSAITSGAAKPMVPLVPVTTGPGGRTGSPQAATATLNPVYDVGGRGVSGGYRGTGGGGGQGQGQNKKKKKYNNNYKK